MSITAFVTYRDFYCREPLKAFLLILLVFRAEKLMLIDTDSLRHREEAAKLHLQF